MGDEMTARRFCVASTVVLLCTLALPARAKPWHIEGFRDLRAVAVSGPGMAGTRRLGGDTKLARTLLRHTGMHLALSSREPLSTAGPPSTSERGPRYLVTYRLTARAAAAYGVDGQVVRQYLFPYADERPWAYVPSGQGPDAARRWWPVSIQLVGLYDRLGLPSRGQIDVTGTSERAVAGSPAGGPGGPDGGTWIAVALIGVLVGSALYRRQVVTRRA
jgi:hypothetical protein